MTELRRDPAFRAREAARDAEIAANRAHYARVAAPVLPELEQAGYLVGSIGEPRHAYARYPDAVPVLVRWLPRIVDAAVKEDIVRTLSVPWARQLATRPLIEAFRSLPEADDPTGTSLRWAIGNGLEILADAHVLDELIAIAEERRYGLTRQMVVLGLARPREPRVVEVLVRLLDDDQVAGHAAMALGRLRARAARPRLERPATEASASWIRKAALKAIARIDAAGDG